MRKAGFRQLLLSGVASVALLAAEASEARAQEISGFYGHIEGGFSFTEGSAQPWAENPAGSFNIDTDHAINGEVGLSYRMGAWTFGIAIGGLHSLEESESVYSGSAYLFNVMAGGTGGIAVYNTIGSVDVDSKLYTVDFEAGYDVGLGDDGFALNVGGGLRFAHFEQDTSATFAYLPIVLPSYILREEREAGFWGIGPRLRVKGEARFHGGFGFGFGAGAAVLFGRQWNNNFSTGGVIGISGPNDDSESKMVFNADARLGLTYSFEQEIDFPAHVMLGYNVSWYDGIKDTTNNVSAFGRSLGTDSGDFLNHGPFLRLTIGLN